MDKHKIVGKRWMSALLALILTMTLLPAPSAAADDSPNGENAIQNPGFENPPIDKTYLYMPPPLAKKRGFVLYYTSFRL